MHSPLSHTLRNSVLLGRRRRRAAYDFHPERDPRAPHLRLRSVCQRGRSGPRWLIRLCGHGVDQLERHVSVQSRDDLTIFIPMCFLSITVRSPWRTGLTRPPTKAFPNTTWRSWRGRRRRRWGPKLASFTDTMSTSACHLFLRNPTLHARRSEDRSSQLSASSIALYITYYVEYVTREKKNKEMIKSTTFLVHL